MNFIGNLRGLLTAIWLGAAIFFVAVAQIAFAVLPTRDLAGSVVNQTLAVINYGGIVIGLVLLGSSFINRKGIAVWFERVLLSILVICCAVGQFIVGYQMALIRQQIGRPIDELAIDDPLRIAFGSWHQYSVWVLLAAMVTALITFFIITKKNKNEIKNYGTY